jgi:acyl-coenzyme A thioesterase PaaI-like protein
MSDDEQDVWPPGLWGPPEPGKLVGRGHGVGDFLEAYEWDVLERALGHLRVRAHLPAQVKNPRGQLFGGFTATYVDFIALHTCRAGRDSRPGHTWLATMNMRVDYYAPITSDAFEMDCRVVNRRASMFWLETRFLEPDSPEGPLLAWAYTTFKEV